MLKKYIILISTLLFSFQANSQVDIQITNNVAKKMTVTFNNDGEVTSVYPGGASAFWGEESMVVGGGGTPTVEADKNNEEITSVVSGDDMFASFTITEKKSGKNICVVKLTGCSSSMKKGTLKEAGCGGFFLKSLNQYVCGTGIIGKDSFIVTIKKEPKYGNQSN